VIGPRSGEPLPPLVAEEPARRPAEPIDVGALRRGPVSGGPSGANPDPVPTGPMAMTPMPLPSGGPPTPVGGVNVYRSRRPALIALLLVAALLFEVPALRVLLSATFADDVHVPGTVAGIFLVAGLPLVAIGLYGLGSGAAATPGLGWRAWARPPLAYLPAGLVLFVCAALAAAP
jgi:hypothetical protein